MVIYFIGMVSIVIGLSIALLYIFKKNSLLNINLVIAIGISSIAICSGVPFAFSALDKVGLGLIPTILITVLVYITCVLVITIGISLFISDKRAKEIWNKVKSNRTVLSIQQSWQNLIRAIGERKIKVSFEGFKEIENKKIENSMSFSVEQDENNIEKSVDSEQNIDKMGIEIDNNIIQIQNVETNICESFNEQILDEEYEEVAATFEGDVETVSSQFVPEESLELDNNKESAGNDSINGQTLTLPSEQAIDNIYYEKDFDSDKNLTVSDYIDHAFRLKASGDYEGAILHYMYALDKKPEKDAVFWIVLDTCVLYKELGQVELAKEILESYVTGYGDVMSISVRTEIEKNLSV